MESFDFQKGGVIFRKYYPELKPIASALVHTSSGPNLGTYYHYEPGNMTRYEVIFTNFLDVYGETITLMSVVCPRNAAMILPKYKFEMYDLDYMQEKLGMGEGDCYALIQLINYHFDMMRNQ
jgi:hypothetical protein